MPRRQQPPPAPVFPELTPEVDLPDYIGVPGGFQQRVDMPARTRNPGIGQPGMVTEEDPYSYMRDPTYLEGSELAIYGMPAPQLAALQRQLERAGLLEPGDYNPGSLTGDAGDVTVSAFTHLLAYANRAGFQSYEAALRKLTSFPLPPNQLEDRARQARAESRLPSVSNPDDLRRVFRSAVINELGTGWSERQIDDLVAAYQAREMQYGAYNNPTPVPGVAETNVAPPNPETFAANAARAFDPGAATGQDFLGVANQFFQLLSGGTPAGEMPA